MITATGLIALALLFVAGPYIFLQKRWPRVWRPLPIWAHANVSLAAAAVTLVHVTLASNKFGLGLTWVATGIFALVTVSGLYGQHVASSGPGRLRWLRFQRWIVYAFYATIVFHLVSETIGFALIPAVAGGWAMWHWRDLIRQWLIASRWPYSRDNSVGRPAVAPWRFFAAWQAVATVAIIGVAVGGFAIASFVGSGDSQSALGHVVAVDGSNFTFEVGDDLYLVITTDSTEIEHIEDGLSSLIGADVLVKVQWNKTVDGVIVAREVEAKRRRSS
ncbi:MAG: hypothetical protein IIB28_03165 [Chloroflexi bacterium]|nr:hypothetical protein [Chloroflexota bacterium]